MSAKVGEPHRLSKTSLGFRAMRALLACTLIVSCFCLASCKTSDTLTELLVDQNSSTVDESNDDSFFNNLLTSMLTTTELPELTRDEEVDLEREREEEAPTLGDAQNANDEVPQAQYRETANPNTAAAAPQQQSTPTAPRAETDSGGSGPDAGEGGPSDEGQTGDDPAPSDNPTVVYRGRGGSGTVYGSGGAYQELPSNVQTAVAFGECANMVQSFAGAHALAGADAAFLNNDFIRRAYGDGIADVQLIAADEASQTFDVAAVCALAPDALFILNNSYVLTEADVAALAEAKVDVVYLPALTSASNITATAGYIGAMFGGPDNTFAGVDAAGRAQEYVRWHNGLVDQLSGQNGLASTVNYDTGGDEGLGTVSRWTLYIDDWDYATYAASPDNMSAWTDVGGVAIAKVGYKWSPLSYYLSVGGSDNNGALFKSVFYDVFAQYYVWQFNLGRVSAVSDANWSRRTKAVSPLSNSGTADLLVRANDGAVSLGAPAFSYVVVRSQAIKAALDSSQAQGEGLYAVYDMVTPTNGSSTGRGFLSGTGSLCESYISGSFGVEVVPSGLYSSWVDGSTESVLEAAWTYDLNNGSSLTGDKVREYYQLFYGYALSDAELSQILAGEVG